MVDQYFTELFDICDQSTIEIHVLKCRKILKNAGNLLNVIQEKKIIKTRFDLPKILSSVFSILSVFSVFGSASWFLAWLIALYNSSPSSPSSPSL